jgi:hypothetical protein
MIPCTLGFGAIAERALGELPNSGLAKTFVIAVNRRIIVERDTPTIVVGRDDRAITVKRDTPTIVVGRDDRAITVKRDDDVIVVPPDCETLH